MAAAHLVVAACLAGLIGALFLTASSEANPPPTLYVAAASDLRFVLEEITPAFGARRAARVPVTLGSSGQLAAQIAQGAPFDVFLSADETLMTGLAGKGLIAPGTIHPFAVGRLVIWVPGASPISVGGGLSVLLGEDVRFVAIANPAHAPYGRAALEALRAAGIYDRIRPRLVFAENVSQALQFAVTGNADAALVALALAVAPSMRPLGRFTRVPERLYRPILQTAGVVGRSRQPRLAVEFLDDLTGPVGRKILRRYGFGLPDRQTPP